MSAPSPFSKAAASTGDSLRPKQDSYSPGYSPTPLAHFPLSSSKGIVSQCPPRPKDAHAVTPGTYPDPPSHLISFSRRGLAGWSLAPLDWVGAGTPQGQQKQELTASFPQSSGWAFGPGHTSRSTLCQDWPLGFSVLSGLTTSSEHRALSPWELITQFCPDPSPGCESPAECSLVAYVEPEPRVCVTGSLMRSTAECPRV